MWLTLGLLVGLALTIAGLAVSYWLAFAAFVGVLIDRRDARAGAAAGQPRQARQPVDQRLAHRRRPLAAAATVRVTAALER